MKLLMLTITGLLLSGCSTYANSMKADPAAGSVAGYEAGICLNIPDLAAKWKPELKDKKGCVDAQAGVYLR